MTSGVQELTQLQKWLAALELVFKNILVDMYLGVD